ncbi:MAG: LysR family transcriptional regulator [Hahellaceae bacterium]|nr:LysR family transcriptional regulator [Hahellaceae bacterium]
MSPLINLDALQVLDAIERRGSFAAAAEELDKVPSSLSYVIQSLEERLGVSLFVRQGRRSVLTQAGRHLLTDGRHILEAIRLLEDQTRHIANGWEPRIRIALESMFNTEKTFEIFETFLQAHPSIEIDIREEVMSGGWEALILDQVDLLIGATGPAPTQQGIHARRLTQLNLIYVVAPQHPLAHEPQPISQDRLALERTVVVHDTARSAIPWTRGIINEGRKFYVSTMDGKLRAQLAGIGGGHLPRQRIQPYLDKGQLIELAIENSPNAEPTEHFIAWKLANHGKGLKQLRERLIAAGDTLVQP